MAQSRIPMEVTVNEDRAHRKVSIVVEHADWQSFSRAVLPRANKAFKGWVRENIVFGSLTRENCSLAWHDVRDQTGRCLSVMTYSY